MRALIVAVLLASLVACRKDPPPPIEVCIGDGFGGGDCKEVDGTERYRSPSEMRNYWSTSQPDMAAFASWCYKVGK